jgi:hypothetical protein
VTAPARPPAVRELARRRQQRRRDRLRSGKRVASIEIDEALIEDALLRAGVLSRIDADDPSKVDAALSEAVETWSNQQITGRPARSCWWSTAARPARGRPISSGASKPLRRCRRQSARSTPCAPAPGAGAISSFTSWPTLRRRTLARAIPRVQHGEARASSTLALACLTICERPFAADADVDL